MSEQRKKRRGHLTKEAGQEMDNWLREHYFEYTSNEAIAEIFGVSCRTVRIHARNLGLSRTKEDHYRRVSEATRKRWNEWKTSDDPAVKAKLELFIERLKASQKEILRLERIREKYGLPRRTKWLVTRRNHKVTQVEKRLKQRGYIIDESKMVAYYTDQTQRSSRSELRVHCFRFMPYGADEAKKVYVRPAYDGNINFN